MLISFHKHRQPFVSAGFESSGFLSISHPQMQPTTERKQHFHFAMGSQPRLENRVFNFYPDAKGQLESQKLHVNSQPHRRGLAAPILELSKGQL